MRYLLLIYEDEKRWLALDEAQQGEIFGEYMAFTESIRASGNYVAGDPLQPSATASMVRLERGQRLVTDGPYAETREQLGGYYKIEAADLDEALAIAARIPSAVRGLAAIEVRPIQEMG